MLLTIYTVGVALCAVAALITAILSFRKKKPTVPLVLYGLLVAALLGIGAAFPDALYPAEPVIGERYSEIIPHYPEQITAIPDQPDVPDEPPEAAPALEPEPPAEEPAQAETTQTVKKITQKVTQKATPKDKPAPEPAPVSDEPSEPAQPDEQAFFEIQEFTVDAEPVLWTEDGVPVVDTVYWGTGAGPYHYTTRCPALNAGADVEHGTIQEAAAAGHSSPCSVCFP